MKLASILFCMMASVQAYFALSQTNDSLKSKYDSETFADTAWGGATNGIQFGVRICAVGPSSAEKFKVFSALYNVTPTNIFGLWKLVDGYRFNDISLRTKDGRLVQRTKLGDSLCKVPASDLSNGRIVVLEAKSVTHFDELFDIRDCFKITEAGTYILTANARLYSMQGYRVFSRLDLPKAQVSFEIKQSELKK